MKANTYLKMSILALIIIGVIGIVWVGVFYGMIPASVAGFSGILIGITISYLIEI